MCWNFFKTGLFAIGGGMATIPFLYEMSDAFGWFSHEDILNMLAVSESTPGPIGINMATFAGFKAGGSFGAVLSSLSITLPSIIVILIVARLLDRFRKNRFVDGAFYVLRPASSALIMAAGFNILLAVFFDVEKLNFSDFARLGEVFTHINWIPVVMCAILFILMRLKPLKNIHPVFFIAISAAAGILLKL